MTSNMLVYTGYSSISDTTHLAESQLLTYLFKPQPTEAIMNFG